ncbi:MAG: hypothetical protein ACM3JH_05015 [Acidithiobacillales bacterium]
MTRRRPGPRTADSPATPPVIVSALRLSVPEFDVLHFLGYPIGRRPAGRLQRLYRDSLREARRLAAGRGVFVTLPVSSAGEVGLPAEEADGLVLGLVTIGAGLERRVTELLDEGKAARALLLDAAGSAAAEEAARRLSARILGGRAGTEEDAACRISPGYGRWPLSAQKSLFERLPHEALGVTLNPSMMMVPRKSISFALWLGARRAPRSGLSGCDTCRLPNCRYRRTPGRGSDERSER